MKSTGPLILIMLLTAQISTAQNKLIPMFVGTYTSEGGSKGIYSYLLDMETCDAELQSEVETPSPSFLARTDKFLIAVNELGGGNQSLSSFNLKDEILTFENKVSTKGAAPCHVLLGDKGQYAVVSNYSGGSLALYSIDKNGHISEMDDFREFKGGSVNKARQNASHIHSAFLGPDKAVYVSDLGADQIYVFDVLKEGGKYKFSEKETIDVPKGSGPRHIAFHPKGKTMYSLQELTGDIIVFKKEKSKWVQSQVINMNDANFKGEHGAADLKISTDGKYLYSTNRVDANTISTFEIKKDGTLSLKQVLSVEGKGPRNLNITPNGKFVLVTNQLSDEIVVFARDTKTGELKDSGKRIEVSKPVCVIF